MSTVSVLDVHPAREGFCNALTPEQWEETRQAVGQGVDPGEFVLARRWLLPDDVLDILEEAYGVPSVTLSWYHPEPAAVALVPQEVARRFGLLPLFTLRQSLYVAMADPTHMAAQDYLQQLTGYNIEPVLAMRHDLEGALNRLFLSMEQSGKMLAEIAHGSGMADALEDASILFEDRDAPAIRMVEHIIAQAVRMRASDIHLECYARRVELRYRVDGILHEFPAPPQQLYPAVISRIKIASSLDIAEKRLPQDGRMNAEVDGVHYDLRVAVIPNLHGEGVVLRLLNTAEMNRNLTDLGFEKGMLERWETLIRKPHGMILVTGPTGSGKTTTLYASLRRVFTPEKKFVTLEDPVEFQIDGITQIQVRTDIGYGFAEGLRAVLRYDPDVVMVGEIRDRDSADIGIRASLTGHLMFSTLHTNNSALAVTRLVDMGLQSYLVLSSVNGILAQRLLRRLCSACKVSYRPDPEHLALLGVNRLPRGEVLYRPAGCPECGHLGYRGRVAVYELLEVTPAMRRLKENEITAERLRQLAAEVGLVSLRESALEKLYDGVTSLQEVLSLTTEE